ncbi:aldose epimerase family protein [Pontibacter actiniarum]|uniref:Aldose 1-epimerase n=1 Tax=Pontibacter actiniarum TaxID=323450 RepID=A0A1X9YRS0_9BACT|nr:aldose epimerase family protein [Pontibacter actiniarum]ARS35586.1 galactose-1-epimerase [Pontibacter actiniarum]
MRKGNTRSLLLMATLLGGLSVSGLSGCSSTASEQETTTTATEATTMRIEKEPFGTTPDGQEISLYTLTNANGVKVKISNYGAIVNAIITPDKNGEMGDVVLGFNDVNGYIPNDPHIGGVIGRFANRIAKGKFTLDGQEYTLAVNNAPNHLHGGNIGFDRVVWQAEEMPEQNAIELTYLSKDMEEGYPGNLTTTVRYTLTDDNGLKIDYSATTDKATPVNLTNHSYFNLSAGEVKDVSNHIIQINADKYTAVDASLIPTGELASVKGTQLDLTQPQPIGKFLNQIPGGGYDHNFVLNKSAEGMTKAAEVYEPTSGRVLEVYTTQPGIQFYTSNFLDGTLTGKNGNKYTRHYAFCLETQHFPDSPNQTGFPSTILRPGETYQESTLYKFSVRADKQ